MSSPGWGNNSTQTLSVKPNWYQIRNQIRSSRANRWNWTIQDSDSCHKTASWKSNDWRNTVLANFNSSSAEQKNFLEVILMEQRRRNGWSPQRSLRCQPCLLLLFMIPIKCWSRPSEQHVLAKENVHTLHMYWILWKKISNLCQDFALHKIIWYKQVWLTATYLVTLLRQTQVALTSAMDKSSLAI